MSQQCHDQYNQSDIASHPLIHLFRHEVYLLPFPLYYPLVDFQLAIMLHDQFPLDHGRTILPFLQGDAIPYHDPITHQYP